MRARCGSITAAIAAAPTRHRACSGAPRESVEGALPAPEACQLAYRVSWLLPRRAVVIGVDSAVRSWFRDAGTRVVCRRNGDLSADILASRGVSLQSLRG